MTDRPGGAPVHGSLLRTVLAAAALCLILAVTSSAQSTPEPQDPITRLLLQLQQAVAANDQAAYLNLLAPDADQRVAGSAARALFDPGITRAVIKERDRACIGAGCRVIVDVLREFGPQARLATLRIDVTPRAAAPLVAIGTGGPGEKAAAEQWAIAGQVTLSSLNGLYKLALDASNVYQARGIYIEAEDFTLKMLDGSAFVLGAAGQPTGVVLVGKGEVTFTPSPATERGQMKIFAGTEQLQAQIEGAYVRVNPGEMAGRVKGLVERQADLRDVKRADEIFREHNGRTFALDLSDLSGDVWSMLPKAGDFLAEIYARRYGSLTFALTPSEAEDVVLFDRKARRNIATYSSRERLTSRGPFYDDDDLSEYSAVDYEIDARFNPDRDWIDAQARMTIVVRAPSLTSLTVRLADGLNVRSVTASGIGRVLPLRIRGRDSIIVSLPAIVTRGTRLVLDFRYSGVIESQSLDSEAIQIPMTQVPQEQQEPSQMVMEKSYIYTNRPFWYPQPAVSGYATATLRLAAPSRYTIVGSGEPVALPPADRTEEATLQKAGFRRFAFQARQPLRYLSCVLTPLVRVKSERVTVAEGQPIGAPRGQGAIYNALDLTVATNPRERSAGSQLAKVSIDILRFYGRLIGDCPYPTLNLALIEQRVPGGHSPAYMAAINHVPPQSGITWRGDPASIDGFPEYFVAHELAHQWWGQAVGWKNYHEQWLSEGLAQYFAALYAEHSHGPDLFQDVLRRWQRWTVDKSEQGPVYLGYRVGHIKGDARAFRAIVYNKGAIVLHMLRRLVGDEAFFRGLRRFYWEWRFRKAGSDDLRRAFEAEARLPLQRFFERWIYSDTLPRVRAVASRTETQAGGELLVRMEQTGTVFDVPITVTLEYSDRPAAEVTLRLVEAQQEFRIPLAGALRRVDLNRLHVVPFSDFAFTSPFSGSANASRNPRVR